MSRYLNQMFGFGFWIFTNENVEADNRIEEKTKQKMHLWRTYSRDLEQ